MRQVITFLKDLEASFDPANDADYEFQTEPVGYEKIDAILSSLSTSMDWLHRLANMIRRASTSRQNANANTFPLKDAQGNDATLVLTQLFEFRIKRAFPKVAVDIKDRLVSTMLLRRRRILYRRSRQAKLAPRPAKPAPKRVKPTHSAPYAVSRLDIPERMPHETKAPMPSVRAPSGTASTQYTATTVEPEAYRRVVSTPSRVSEARTIAMPSDYKDMIPWPPRVADNAHDFICPFCCLILPARYAQNPDVWSAHVKKDLEPYVCVFFPCKHGEDIFGTSAEWISHEQQTHCMRWYCTTKTHRSEVYASQNEFIAHMKAEHLGKFKEPQLPLLAEHSRRPLKRIFKACPLCGEEGVEKGKGLEDHVAHHLQYLALLSLPLYDDADDPENTRSESSPESHGEKMGATSRMTLKSERHAMPAATFCTTMRTL